MDHSLIGSAFVLLQVVLIDLTLAADNAVVVGLAAAGLEGKNRTKAIAIGIGTATIFRVGFALVASVLLEIVGLTLAGGFLLLWVCWKMWRDLRSRARSTRGASPLGAKSSSACDRPRKTLGQAVWQIIAADISMSLDNVLAVAGAAHENPAILAAGLVLSVLLMGVAASMLARALDRFQWIAYLGLLVVLFVSLNMIYHGAVKTSLAIGMG